MAKMYGKGKSAIESEEQQRLRWQVELEFVQCLANPNYLNFLAQRGFFKEQTFINYLKYLQYWKEPEYSKYLMYPMCLYFLDLLQYEHFRREIVNSQCCKFIDDQAILQWQHYTRKRMKIFNTYNNGIMPGTGQMNSTGAANAVGSATGNDQQNMNDHMIGNAVMGGMHNGLSSNSVAPNMQQSQQLNGIASNAGGGGMQK